MKQYFSCLKQRKLPENEYQMIGWIEAIVGEFFGGFITIDISDRKKKLCKKEAYYYYTCSINPVIYLELSLNKHKSVYEKYVFWIYQEYF